MRIKAFIMQVEKAVLGTLPVRVLVRFLLWLGFRARWLWGRIRFGALVRNRGLGCVCAWDADLKYPGNIQLGERVIIGSNVSLGAHSPIRIGDHVRISRDVIIETAGLDFSTGAPPYRHVSKPIIIEKGVWIGARAMVLGGVTIGENAVVAAGAIVTRSVPPGQVVAGVPAKPIGRQPVSLEEESV